MTTVWICHGKGMEPEYFDTEKAAESRRAWLEDSKTVATAVIYPVNVEPPVRRWRKSA